MDDALANDVTLRELTTKLSDPEDFVRRVVEVMHYAAKEHGPVSMRLGITGTGRLPNYRLEDAISEAPIRAINGNNHQPWPEHEAFQSANNWSSRTMTGGEVKSLLGELRSSAPPTADRAPSLS